MIQNIIKVALRFFLRQKFYSFINLFGLTTGLVCSLLIGLWIHDEVTKNQFHSEIDRIYHISTILKSDGQVFNWPVTPGLMADEIQRSLPDVERTARTLETGSILFQSNNKDLLEKGLYADSSFFKIFSFRVLNGNLQNPLPDRNAIVISSTFAKKLFGDLDPVGKVIRIQKTRDLKVTAVVDNGGEKSSIKFDFILSFELHKDDNELSWDNLNYQTYLKANRGVAHTALMNKINHHIEEVIGKIDSDYKQGTISFYLQPFADRYLYSNFENGLPVGGRIGYVKILSAVALFILFIASINFTNMATARAVNRSKEVGIRKVAGAGRKTLILQFMSEAIALTLIAMILALTIVQLLLPMFNIVVSKQIEVPYGDAIFIAATIATVLITGVLAGGYPAFVLSSFQPTQVLKINSLSGAGAGFLRKGLVVFQFSLTVILIASAIVVYQQINYINNMNLGYDRSSIITFEGRNIHENFQTFKNELLKSPYVKTVSGANQMLIQIENQNSSVWWPGKPENSRFMFRTIVVDYDFVETMGLELKEGRSFSEEMNDTTSFILSQAAVDLMGLREPLGTTIKQWGQSGKVVGVVEDFHSRSLHEAIDPVVLMRARSYGQIVHVKFDPTKTQEVIALLQTIYGKYNPDYPFSYTFMDENFDNMYQNESIMATLASGFTLMAVVISSLGMLGLAAFTTARRRKEISVRKSLGASVTGIVSMISMDFVKLSLLATIIGCPIAYFVMDEFLNTYIYHTQLDWTIFLFTALAIFMITIFTVIFQVVKAALTNPVDALRSE